jgi:hypothetical protein
VTGDREDLVPSFFLCGLCDLRVEKLFVPIFDLQLDESGVEDMRNQRWSAI